MSLRIETAKILLMIPTYNERENIDRLYADIRSLLPTIDLLFLDDNSPDGTGKAIDAIIKSDSKVFAVHRPGKMGVGSAHFDGINWAYDHGYEYIVTMDCDFTHPPKYILTILEERETADILVGSRFIKEKSLAGWNLLRRTLTWTGHILTTQLLDLPYDATGGFRLYNLKTIPQHAFKQVSSLGYSFFFESLFIFNFNKFRIKEIPIELPPRTYGHSKMVLGDVFKSLKLLFVIFSNKLLNEERYIVCDPLKKTEIDPKLQETQGWDQYWADQKSSGRILYDLVAAFYRKFIIKRNLSRFIKNTFEPGKHLLHAGCGSGQVDKDVVQYADVTGLDISVNALNFYKRVHRGQVKVLHGSIFSIPTQPGTFDGIYNLGVMEHFTEDEIQKILVEFHRILKPGGKMVIFWPPEYGLSVLFFKALTFIFKNLLKKENVKFHPDEISRVQSESQARQIFTKSGFKVVKYYFGIQDLFTYAIFVVERI